MHYWKYYWHSATIVACISFPVISDKHMAAVMRLLKACVCVWQTNILFLSSSYRLLTVQRRVLCLSWKVASFRAHMASWLFLAPLAIPFVRSCSLNYPIIAQQGIDITWIKLQRSGVHQCQHGRLCCMHLFDFGFHRACEYNQETREHNKFSNTNNTEQDQTLSLLNHQSFYCSAGRNDLTKLFTEWNFIDQHHLSFLELQITVFGYLNLTKATGFQREVVNHPSPGSWFCKQLFDEWKNSRNINCPCNWYRWITCPRIACVPPARNVASERKAFDYKKVDWRRRLVWPTFLILGPLMYAPHRFPVSQPSQPPF